MFPKPYDVYADPAYTRAIERTAWYEICREREQAADRAVVWAEFKPARERRAVHALMDTLCNRVYGAQRPDYARVRVERPALLKLLRAGRKIAPKRTTFASPDRFRAGVGLLVVRGGRLHLSRLLADGHCWGSVPFAVPVTGADMCVLVDVDTLYEVLSVDTKGGAVDFAFDRQSDVLEIREGHCVTRLPHVRAAATVLHDLLHAAGIWV